EELVVADGGDPLGDGVDGGDGDVELGAEVSHGGPGPLDGGRLGAIGVLAPQQRALPLFGRYRGLYLDFLVEPLLPLVEPIEALLVALEELEWLRRDLAAAFLVITVAR
ncbi:Os02g0175250, partial [Oryza sativa Japonica Group]